VTLRTAVLTAAALLAFAGNSILARLALASGRIDPASFSTVRLVAGACVLLMVSRVGRRAASSSARLGGSWSSALLLFVYAVPFSYAYVSLALGTGALILFGAVQVTMMLAAIRAGVRPHARQWMGLLMAIGGLVYLVSPGLSAPAVSGSLAMTVAGVAWGIYSVRGRRSTRPLAETTGNFVRAVPMTLLVSLAAVSAFRTDARGALLAAASGGVTSGLGYVVWYAALAGLGPVRAAIVQISTPVITAVAGVLLLGEAVSTRLVGAAVLILGGVAMALTKRESA
jgi:drug/metabolite transporter (DMT)-like permease